MSTKKAFIAVIIITFFANTKFLWATLNFPQNNEKYSNYLVSSVNATDFSASIYTIEAEKIVNPYVNLFSRNTSEYVEYQYVYGKENIEEEEVLNVKTLLDDISVNNIDPLTKDELVKKEIQKLNQELDELNEKLKSLKKENNKLKDEIEKYNNENRLKEKQQTLIEGLKKEARTSKINLDLSNVPDKYISALDLLLIGDIDLAQKQFIDFINIQSKDKKSKEYLNSTSSNQINIFIANSYYWLGRINNINGNYKNAVENFSLAYKITDFNSLSLIALIGLIESLTNLSKNIEACITIKQFMQDYDKALNNKSFPLDKSYLELVENYKSINKCQ